MVDVASAEVTEAIEAHAEGREVWGLSPAHDGKGFASASADQTVKFWDFELLGDGGDASTKRLSAVHRRTLKLEEDALAVNLSADGRLVAVALLDSTVKVGYRPRRSHMTSAMEITTSDHISWGFLAFIIHIFH